MSSMNPDVIRVPMDVSIAQLNFCIAIADVRLELQGSSITSLEALSGITVSIIKYYYVRLYVIMIYMTS